MRLRQLLTRLLAAPLLLACAATLVWAPLAHANDFQRIFQNYTHNQGRLTPCAFSPAALQRARSQIPNDIQQYAPDFPLAINAALAAWARGDCSPHTSGGTPAPPVTSAPTSSGGAAPPSSPGPAGTVHQAVKPLPTTPAPPVGPALRNGADSGVGPLPAHPARKTSAPAAVVLLGGLGALLALVALAAFVFGRLGIGARWLGPFGHAWSEAGLRARTTFADFGDWVRLGGR